MNINTYAIRGLDKADVNRSVDSTGLTYWQSKLSSMAVSTGSVFMFTAGVVNNISGLGE